MISPHSGGERKDMETENGKTLQVIFAIGENYTIFQISSTMAITNRTELTVKSHTENGIIFCFRGKRKLYGMPLETRHYEGQPLKPFTGAIFKGWDQPIICDTDNTGSINAPAIMRGNACYNFIGTPAIVRDWIVKNQLNPYFDRAAVLAIEGENETVVFSDEYKGGHAVIDRLMSIA